MWSIIVRIFGMVSKFLPAKMWLGIAFIIAIVFAYNLGYSGGKSDFKIKQQLDHLNQQNEILLSRLKSQEETTSLNAGLSNTLNKITEEKYHADKNTDEKLHYLVDRYANDSMQLNPDDHRFTVRDVAASVRATRETVVVKLPDEWGFSSKDRRTLLQEAARADKTAEELKRCKAVVESIYQTHEAYKKLYEQYKSKLRQP